MKRTTVLVADGASIFRSAVRSLLARASDLEVFDAATGDEAVSTAAELRPAVALVDLALPPDGGIETIRRLAAVSPATTRIAWGKEADPDVVLAAVRAGANGFLEKDIGIEGLVRALRGTEVGEAAFSRTGTAALVGSLHTLDARQRARERASHLTTRERQILTLVASGLRNRDIGADLFISELTVKRHVQNILRKLDQTSRRGAADFYLSSVELADPLPIGSYA